MIYVISPVNNVFYVIIILKNKYITYLNKIIKLAAVIILTKLKCKIWNVQTNHKEIQSPFLMLKYIQVKKDINTHKYKD